MLNEILVPVPGTYFALKHYIMLLLWTLDLMAWLTLIAALNGILHLLSVIKLMLVTCHLP